MVASTVLVAVVTVTVAKGGIKHLRRMIEQLKQLETLANYDNKHNVDVSYSYSIIKKKKL